MIAHARPALGLRFEHCLSQPVSELADVGCALETTGVPGLRFSKVAYHLGQAKPLTWIYL